MLERRGDLWILAHELNADAVCITTNGAVRSNGSAILGLGCALEAATKYPWFPEALGISLKMHGLRVQAFKNLQYNMSYTLVSFPVKPAYVIANNMSTNIVSHKRWNYGTGVKAPGWAAVADLDLLKRSSHELMELIGLNQWQCVVMVRPGVGAGELTWDEVKTVIEPILDNRVVVVRR